ncbi:hypothetical protein CI102_7278 [Trichoderma harzianum]|nr:hypothetical protein CI102_7278 [Trichoderma harzianum]
MQYHLHGILRPHSAAYQASGCLSLQGGVVDVNAAVRLENMSRHIMPNPHRASTGTTEQTGRFSEQFRPGTTFPACS